jgi:hypothetical protein
MIVGRQQGPFVLPGAGMDSLVSGAGDGRTRRLGDVRLVALGRAVCNEMRQAASGPSLARLRVHGVTAALF